MLVAVDDGPRAALQPLAEHWKLQLCDTQDFEADHQQSWDERFGRAATRLLVIGTSDSAHGRQVEASARRAAVHCGIPIAAIEDFPGNYSRIADGSASLLVVESEFSRELNRTKLQQCCPRIMVIAPARYDHYRERNLELRSNTARCWDAPNSARLVMWAGQPETQDAINTLAALIPALRTENVAVLFKAHPRDRGYQDGVYQKLFAQAGVPYQDITASTVAEVLALAPRLVITQFSSVAVEAGFYGVPALHVLLANMGADRLLAKKGYPVPPLCLVGGAALVTDLRQLGRELSRALHNPVFRAGLIGCFDDYFKTGESATPQLAQRLIRLASGAKETS